MGCSNIKWSGKKKKKKSVSNEMERNAKSVYQEAMGKHCF